MLAGALESVRSMNHNGLEIIVVDDGSVDGSAEMVAGRFPEVKLIRLSGVGPGLARDVGVGASRAEVVMFLDSDDLWLPGHVSELLGVLARGYEVAYGTVQTVDEVSGGAFLIPEGGKGARGDCFAEILQWCFLIPSALALTRKAYEQSGGFGERTPGEDWVFFLKLADHYDFGFAGPVPISLRRLHHRSLSASGDVAVYAATVRVLRETYLTCTRSVPGTIQRLSDLEKWILDKGAQWTTVQQWYSAMKLEGLIKGE